MKPSIALAFVSVLLALLPPARADELFLKNDTVKSGEIVSTSDGRVSLRVQVGAGFGVAGYAFDSLKKVGFTPTPAEQKMMSNPGASDVAVLRRMWELREPLLGQVESDAPTVATALSRALLADTDPERAREALALLEKALARGSLTPAEQSALLQSTAAALMGAGRVDEAVKLLDTMPEIDPAASAAIIENRVRLELIRGDLALGKLRALEEEWPKWELMPEEREQHRRLLHEALSAFLFPAAIHPENRAVTADGLYRAAQLFASVERPEDALRRVDEILSFYPEPVFAKKAAELQTQLKSSHEPKP